MAILTHTLKQLESLLLKTGSEVFVVSAEIEQEISELDDDEKQMFLEDLGISESGLDKLIKASYSLLGLSATLHQVKMKQELGQLRKVLRLHRLPERFTQTLNVDLSVPKLLLTKT